MVDPDTKMANLRRFKDTNEMADTSNINLENLSRRKLDFTGSFNGFPGDILRSNSSFLEMKAIRPNEMEKSFNDSDPNLDPVDGIVSLLSAIYCQILVVIGKFFPPKTMFSNSFFCCFSGLCFPIAEVISQRISITWYEGFYLYLYTGSILFLLFVYIFLLNRKRKPFGRMRNFLSSLKFPRSNSEANPKDFEASSSDSSDSDSYDFDPSQQLQCGSFYLRVGAVAFGVGSMIYSGLEFGQFFEIDSKEHCYSLIYGLTPGSHMMFTFVQLYFIFMNSRVLIARHKLIGMFVLLYCLALSHFVCVCSSFWFDAHDWHQYLCLATRVDPGNETSNYDDGFAQQYGS